MHCIRAIITSFQYEGDLPNIELIENVHLIPRTAQNSEKVSGPFLMFSNNTEEIIKDLSFKGKCAYIETDFWGGSGTQLASVWENGELLEGPFISFHHMKNEDKEIPDDTTMKYFAINHCLKSLGVNKANSKDEFDTIGLVNYRSNHDILKSIKEI